MSILEVETKEDRPSLARTALRTASLVRSSNMETPLQYGGNFQPYVFSRRRINARPLRNSPGLATERRPRLRPRSSAVKAAMWGRAPEIHARCPKVGYAPISWRPFSSSALKYGTPALKFRAYRVIWPCRAANRSIGEGRKIKFRPIEI